MRKLEVGDKFVVVSKPVYIESLRWMELMDEFCGKKLTITQYDYFEKCYAVEENNCAWNISFIDWEETEKLYETQKVVMVDMESKKPIDEVGINRVENDIVNAPSHYCTGKVETIESIKNIVTGNPSEFQSYAIGNVVKYISRYHKKGGAEDIKKAIKYLEFVLQDLEDDEKKV